MVWLSHLGLTRVRFDNFYGQPGFRGDTTSKGMAAQLLLMTPEDL